MGYCINVMCLLNMSCSLIVYHFFCPLSGLNKPSQYYIHGAFILSAVVVKLLVVKKELFIVTHKGNLICL